MIEICPFHMRHDSVSIASASGELLLPPRPFFHTLADVFDNAVRANMSLAGLLEG